MARLAAPFGPPPELLHSSEQQQRIDGPGAVGLAIDEGEGDVDGATDATTQAGIRAAARPLGRIAERVGDRADELGALTGRRRLGGGVEERGEGRADRSEGEEQDRHGVAEERGEAADEVVGRERGLYALVIDGRVGAVEERLADAGDRGRTQVGDGLVGQ